MSILTTKISCWNFTVALTTEMYTRPEECKSEILSLVATRKLIRNRRSLSNEPLFLTYVLPDGTFTNQANALVVEHGKLQRVPPTIQSTFGQTPEGCTMMMVEDGGPGTRQQRELFVNILSWFRPILTMI